MKVVRPCLLACVLIYCTAAAASTDVRVNSDTVPPILAGADLPDGIAAVAISPDGRRLAYAIASTKEGFTDLVWLEDGAPGAAPVTIPGTVRDVVFLADGGTLFGLHHRPAKKRQGDTFLFAWDGKAKIERIMRVPPSANDLDRWPAGDAIVLASRNEIRTFLAPDFRSGPLFSFPGNNFAVTSLGNSNYVVVGQDSGVFLIDLSVPSGRVSMPVLASMHVPARVAALADDAEGDEVLVRLIDGRLFRAAFDPPGLKPAGTADHIVGMAKSASGPVLPFAPAAPRVANEATPEEPVVIVAELHETPEAEPEPAPEEPTTEPEATPEPAPETRPAVATGPGRREAPTHQLEGRIVGKLELVEAVVLLGPDNILREAARVQPQRDGTWHVDGLDSGRYRVQLDGGGDLVLVAEPRFLMVDVAKTPTRAPEIKAVRSF